MGRSAPFPVPPPRDGRGPVSVSCHCRPRSPMTVRRSDSRHPPVFAARNFRASSNTPTSSQTPVIVELLALPCAAFVPPHHAIRQGQSVQRLHSRVGTTPSNGHHIAAGRQNGVTEPIPLAGRAHSGFGSTPSVIRAVRLATLTSRAMASRHCGAWTRARRSSSVRRSSIRR